MSELSARDLLHLTRSELLDVMRGGHAIDPRALDDTEYRGVSLGLPALVERLTWKKFKKVFHRDPVTGRLRGWNVRLEQNGLDGPWIARRRRGEPVTFGHYDVVDPAGYAMPEPCHGGLMLDYGSGLNRRLDPMQIVRDPIVAVHPGDDALLLGWTYLDLKVRQVGTPSFFTLERDVPLSHTASPPGPGR